MHVVGGAEGYIIDTSYVGMIRPLSKVDHKAIVGNLSWCRLQSKNIIALKDNDNIVYTILTSRVLEPLPRSKRQPLDATGCGVDLGRRSQAFSGEKVLNDIKQWTGWSSTDLTYVGKTRFMVDVWSCYHMIIASS